MSEPYFFPQYPRKPHQASGQARIKIKGRHYYLGKFGSPESHQEHARLAAEVALRASKGDTGPPVRASKVTVGDVVVGWLKATTVEKGETKEVRTILRALTVLDRLYGHTLAADVDAERLEVVRLAMATGFWLTDAERAERASKRQPVGWCRNQCNSMTRRIRTVWRWAEKTKLVPRGSWNHLRTLTALSSESRQVRHTQPRKAATWEQVSAILGIVPPIVSTMLVTQWHSGMRPGEVVKLRPCGIEKEEVAGCWLYRFEKDKNSWRGLIPPPALLGPECQKALAPWLAAVRSPDSFLFPPSRRRLNAHYTTEAYNQCVRRACLVAKVKRFTPYQIRHAAKRSATRSMGLDHARALLRQRSIATTNEYDAEIDQELAAEVARKIG